jgi:hypothetical protein
MASSGDDWGQDFAELTSHVGRLAEASHQTAEWVRRQLTADDAPRVGPVDLPPSMNTLMQEVEQVGSLVSELSDRLHLRPLAFWTHGYLWPPQSI